MLDEKVFEKPPIARLPMDVATGIIARVEPIRAHQHENGAVAIDFITPATEVLQNCIPLLYSVTAQFPTLATCLQDMEEWLAAGLDTPPRMRHLIAQGLAPLSAGEDMILTVTNTLNHSTNQTLELLYFSRDTPPAGASTAQKVCMPTSDVRPSHRRDRRL